MRCATYIRQIRLAFLLVLFIGIGLPSLSEAITYFYVDPTYTGGSNDGSAAHPWLKLYDTTQWDVVNTALASDDVTVFFSARIVASDTAETSTDSIYLRRTDGSTHLLTLNGRSKYNTNDSAGSWGDYSGSNKFTITNSNGAFSNPWEVSYIHRNYITIDGFNFAATTSNGAVVEIGGSNFTVKNCTISHGAYGPTTGAGINVGYARYGGRERYGSLTNITIQDNTISHTYGEGIYIGGSADMAGNAHSNITISGNTISDTGQGAGEADGIDIKDANSNIIVSNNVIYHTSVISPYKQGDGIVTESAVTIERNFIYNFPRAGIQLVEVYDTYTGYRNGPIIRNNIIVSCGNNSSNEGANGISIYLQNGGDTWSNVKIYNNTIFGQQGAAGHGIRFYNGGSADTSSGNDVRNNIVSQCAGDEFRADSNFTFAYHDYNNYYDTSGNIYRYGSTIVAYNGNLAAQEAHSIKTDPLLISTSAPYSALNFRLQPTSLCKDVGVTLTGFSNDYAGTTRPQGSGWDIGAIEAFQEETPLSPKNLRIVN